MTGYPTDQSAHSHNDDNNDDNEDDEHEDDGGAAAAATATTAGLTLFSLVYLGSLLLTVCDRPLSAAFQHSFFFNLPRSSYLSLIPLLAGSLVLLPNTRRQSAIRQQSRRAISCATIAASTAAA